MPSRYPDIFQLLVCYLSRFLSLRMNKLKKNRGYNFFFLKYEKPRSEDTEQIYILKKIYYRKNGSKPWKAASL